MFPLCKLGNPKRKRFMIKSALKKQARGAEKLVEKNLVGAAGEGERETKRSLH